MHDVVQVARGLVETVRGFDPRGVEVGVARDLLGVLSELERLVCARRLAVATVLDSESCGERTVAVALARAGGVSIGRAKEELRRDALIREVDEVARAVFEGELSSHVGGIIARAATHDPGCVGELRRIASDESLEALVDEARRIARRAEEETTTRQREAVAHAKRRCAFSIGDTGGVSLRAFLPLKEGIAVKGIVEEVARGLSTKAARGGAHEEFTRHMADALCRVVVGGEGGGRVEAHVFIHAAAGALKRGRVGHGECCEVDGLGEISLDAAREYMDEGLVTLLVEDGTSIRSIARTTRYVTPKLKDALCARDRRCVVPGCGSTFALEAHHYKIPFRRGGLTCLDNLCHLCSFHHALTEKGYSITGGPGAWEWHEPDDVVRRC